MTPRKYSENRAKLLREALSALNHLDNQVTGESPRLSLREINLWGRRIWRSYTRLEAQKPKGRLTAGLFKIIRKVGRVDIAARLKRAE